MSLTQTGWSQEEKQIVEQILQKSYQKEVALLIDHVRQKITNLSDIEELWQVHDLLSAKRYDLDGKYDTRESMLVFTLAELVKEKAIDIDDLKCLQKDKLAKISSLASM